MDFPLKFIKLITYSFLSIFLSTFGFAVDLQPLTIRDFKCGLVTTYDPTIIGDSCAQDLQNVDIWTGRLQKRRGTILQNTTDLGGYSSQSTRFLHEFPDQNGIFWLISVSSATIFKSNNAGVTNDILTSTHGFSTTSDFGAVNAFGKVRLTDGTTNWITFNGNIVEVDTTSPKGNLTAFFYERVFVAGVSGQKSKVFGSRFGDVTDWTDDSDSDDDAIEFFVAQNDGYDIKAIIPFKNTLLFFKPYSIYALTTNDGLTFSLDPISTTKGTQHKWSIITTENTIRFIAEDGFYEFTGSNFTKLSDDIDPTFNSILQRNSSTRSYIETTQADFTAGSSTNVSVSISPNSVVLSTFQFVDTSSTDFNAGTIGTSLSITESIGSIVFATTTLTTFDDFSDGDFTNNPTWQLSKDGNDASVGVVDQAFQFTASDVGSSNEIYGSSSVYTGGVLTYSYVTTYSANWRAGDILNVVCLSTGTSTENPEVVGSYCFISRSDKTIFSRVVNNSSTEIFELTGFTFTSGTTSTVKIARSDDGTFTIFIDNIAKGSGNDTTFSTFNSLHFGIGLAAPTRTNVTKFDDVKNTPVLTSTFTSQAFSFNKNITPIGDFDTTFSLNGATITFAVYSDSNTSIDVNSISSYISSASVVDDTNFSLSLASYTFYSINFTRTDGSLKPTVNDVTLNFKSSTGSYLSQAISFGSNINSFGAFRENSVLDGGSLAFTFFTDTNTALTPSNSSTWIASQTITNNAIPNIATNTFGRILAEWTITDYDQDTELQDYTVNWNEGGANFPIWCLYYNKESLCGVSLADTAKNDTVLVLDRNYKWTKYNGFSSYSMTRYNQLPYFGDATRGRIFRWQVDNTYTDNGAAISSLWISKEFDFGYPIEDKVMQRYYITAQRRVGTDVVFLYGVNRGTTTSVTLDLGSIAGFFRKIIKPSSFTYQRGISHAFRFSDSDVDDPFDILSVTMFPRLETSP